MVALGDLSPKERQAYALADNKLALNAGWDQELLALEFQELIEAGFEVELTGFSLAEVDFTLDAARQQQPGRRIPQRIGSSPWRLPRCPALAIYGGWGRICCSVAMPATLPPMRA